MSAQSKIFNLIKAVSGQANILTIPRIFIKMCHGDHLAALFINQCLYWSDKTKDPEGFFYKSAEEWDAEIGMSYFQISRVVKSYGNLIETKIQKVNGAPTSHYKINKEALEKTIIELLDIEETKESKPLDIQETQKSDIEETEESETEETQESLTKTTQKLPEIIARAFMQSAKVKLIANERGAEIDLGFMPEELRPLAGAFAYKFGRVPTDKAKRSQWIKELWEQHKLFFTPEVIDITFTAMQIEGLTIKSPGSLTNVAWDMISKEMNRQRGENNRIIKAAETY